MSTSLLLLVILMEPGERLSQAMFPTSVKQKVCSSVIPPSCLPSSPLFFSLSLCLGYHLSPSVFYPRLYLIFLPLFATGPAAAIPPP
jgi:hypothetical protein